LLLFYEALEAQNHSTALLQAVADPAVQQRLFPSTHRHLLKLNTKKIECEHNQ